MDLESKIRDLQGALEKLSNDQASNFEILGGYTTSIQENIVYLTEEMKKIKSLLPQQHKEQQELLEKKLTVSCWQKYRDNFIGLMIGIFGSAGAQYFFNSLTS